MVESTDTRLLHATRMLTKCTGPFQLIVSYLDLS